MSNFKGWTSEAIAQRERAQLAKRLDAHNAAKAKRLVQAAVEMFRYEPMVRKAAKSKKQNPEYEIQAAFVAKMAEKYPLVMVFSDTAAHIEKTIFQQIRANKLQSEIAKDWPDVFVAQPSGDYAGLFLEFKSKTPYLKDGVTLSRDKHIRAQAATMDRLRERGYFCAFVWDSWQAIQVVKSYLEAQ